MRRFAAASLLAALFALPGHSLEESAASRVKERVRKAVEDGLERGRKGALEVVERELSPRTPAAVVAKVRSEITIEECEEGVRFLASDELKGRDTGSKGHRAAAKWAAGIFERAGLKPVGDDQTYFQAWKFGKKKTMNVVAFLPGTTDEVIVVGAHLDHVGTGEAGWLTGRAPNKKAGDDKIYNGADDNASGSCALVQAATALAALGETPRRGILFILFSGEEKGLLGAVAYCRNPIFPLEKTVAMINLDMVGRNADHLCAVTGTNTSPELASALQQANREIGMKLTVDPTPKPGRTGQVSAFFNASDHYVFYQKGIPVLFFTSGLHPEYHTALDHADLINFGKIEEVAELTAVLVRNLAAETTKPTLVKIQAQGNKPKLGVMPTGVPVDSMDELGLAPGEGGVLLNSVTQGFPAATAGLKAGDVVIAFDDRPLSRESALGDFREAIQQAKPGSSQKVTVIRDGQRREFTVKYEADEE